MSDNNGINFTPYIGAFITLLAAVYAKQNTNKLHFIDSFNEIYRQTFSLRSKISIITQEEKNCNFYYELDTILHSVRVREAILCTDR